MRSDCEADELLDDYDDDGCDCACHADTSADGEAAVHHEQATAFELPDLRKLVASGGYTVTVARYDDGEEQFHIVPMHGGKQRFVLCVERTR